jgi:hypothetical protein
MYAANPGKFSVYGKSGETMFGLDRHAGHDLFYKTPRKTSSVTGNLKNIESGVYEYKSPEAKEFWKTVDSANAKNTWKWNYRGGSNEDKLTVLASSIMYPEFMKLANKYLDDESKKIIFSDPRLLFHFVYATWNGSGFFKYYAQAFNKKVKESNNIDVLLADSLQQRLSSQYSMIVQSGRKMLDLFSQKNFIDKFKQNIITAENEIKGNAKYMPLLFAALVIAGILISKKLQS